MLPRMRNLDPHAKTATDTTRGVVGVLAIVALALTAGIVRASPDDPYSGDAGDPVVRVAPLDEDALPADPATVNDETDSTESRVLALLPGRVDDVFIELGPSRDVNDIRRDINRARDRQSEAERILAESRANEARAKAQIDVQKSTIEHLKSQAKLAKEEKRDADRLDFDRRRDMEELVLKAFERQRDLRRSERNYAEALRDQAKQAIETHSVELKLADARAERGLLGTSRTADLSRASAVERQIRAYESDALEVMKSLADKEIDVASRRKAIMERRQKVMEAQSEIRTAELR